MQIDVELPGDAEPHTAAFVGRGDALVLAFAERLTQQQAHEIRDVMRSVLPATDTVIVSECSDLAVHRDYQPDDQAIERWILRNPKAFANWIAQQSRIRGTRIGHYA